MLTNNELETLLNQIDRRLKPQWDRLEALERQIKELDHRIKELSEKPKSTPTVKKRWSDAKSR